VARKAQRAAMQHQQQQKKSFAAKRLSLDSVIISRAESMPGKIEWRTQMIFMVHTLFRNRRESFFVAVVVDLPTVSPLGGRGRHFRTFPKPLLLPRPLQFPAGKSNQSHSFFFFQA